jgi:hypothetical protein
MQSASSKIRRNEFSTEGSSLTASIFISAAFFMTVFFKISAATFIKKPTHWKGAAPVYT